MGTQGEFFERPDTVLLPSGVSDHPTTDHPMIDHPMIDHAEIDHAATDELTHSQLLVSLENSSSERIPNGTITRAENPSQARMTDHPRTMKDLSIPKLYYSISEVSRLTGLEPYVLRYWETEFSELRPQKTAPETGFIPTAISSSSCGSKNCSASNATPSRARRRSSAPSDSPIPNRRKKSPRRTTPPKSHCQRRNHPPHRLR